MPLVELHDGFGGLIGMHRDQEITNSSAVMLRAFDAVT
jgi:hypothetical protein